MCGRNQLFVPTVCLITAGQPHLLFLQYLESTLVASRLATKADRDTPRLLHCPFKMIVCVPILTCAYGFLTYEITTVRQSSSVLFWEDCLTEPSILCF